MKYFEELLEGNIKAYPYTFIIDESGKKLDHYYGYPSSETKIDSLTRSRRGRVFLFFGRDIFFPLN